MQIPVSISWRMGPACLFACLLALSPAYAQAAVRGEAKRDVSGYVRDGETGEALPHASVLFLGTKLGAGPVAADPAAGEVGGSPRSASGRISTFTTSTQS